MGEVDGIGVGVAELLGTNGVDAEEEGEEVGVRLGNLIG